VSINEKRLNKYISDSGYCSRRFADKLIENNRVTINGKVPELGTKVVPGDKVCVDGMEIKASASNHTDRIYIAYNKPIGITCTTERHVKGNIIDAIGHSKRIFPIGRLDKLSDGLLLGIIKKKKGSKSKSKAGSRTSDREARGGKKEERHKMGKQAHKSGRPKKGSKLEVS